MTTAQPTASRLAALALLAAAALGGCAGSDSAETRFYVLAPLGPDTDPLPGARREPPIALDVAPLGLPQYLERRQVVTRAADNRLALAEYEQWGGNLGEDMQRVLARNLSRLLATPEVTMSSRRPPGQADARVEIEVLEFERGPDRRVELSARWRLLRGREPLLARVTEIASAPVADAPGMDATVAAMSALLGDLSRTIAEAVVGIAKR